MLFRQTENFNDNEIDQFLASLGARPGADSNATTHYDYTDFNLMIPVDESTIDFGYSDLNKGIKVLSDMALRGKFVDLIVKQEKKIVLEEFRNSLGSKVHLNSLLSQVALSGTPYENKTPRQFLNASESINTKKILDFYKKWYVPHQMAVIIVGAFKDPKIIIDLVEKHFETSYFIKTNAIDNIRDYFSDSLFQTINFNRKDFSNKNPFSNNENIYPNNNLFPNINSYPDDLYPNPENNNPSFSVLKKKTNFIFETKVVSKSYSHIVFLFRYVEPELYCTLSEVKMRHNINILTWIINNRANHLINCHLGQLINLVASESRLTSIMRVFEIGITCTSGCELEMFTQVLIEIERLKRFPLSEQDMSQIKLIVEELGQHEYEMKSQFYSSEKQTEKLLNYFLYQEPFEDPKIVPNIFKNIITNWKSSDIKDTANQILNIDLSVVFASISQINKSEQIQPPKVTELDFLKIVYQVKKIQLDPIIYFKSINLLCDNLPAPGYIVSEKNIGQSFVYKLSNGVKIQINPFDYHEGYNTLGVDLEFIAEGGLADAWVESGIQDFHSAMLANYFAKYISIGGISLTTSPFELGVVLENLDSFLFERRAKFSCLLKRIEVMFQIIHLLFTRHPNHWPKDFCLQEIQFMIEQSQSQSTESKLKESAIELSWKQNKLIKAMQESDFASFDYDKCRKWFERAWSNPSEFLFILTGDFTSDSKLKNVLKMIEKYLGSIPMRTEDYYNSQLRSKRLLKTVETVQKCIQFESGIIKKTLFIQQESLGLVLLTFPMPSLNTQLEVNVVEIITSMLESHLLAILRNNLGNIYSISIKADHYFGHFLPGQISIQFSCDPNQSKFLTQSVILAIQGLQIHGPSHQLLEASRAIYIKKMQVKPIYREDDSIKIIFGVKVPTKDLDLILDNKMVKRVFNLLFPLKNYTQIFMIPKKTDTNYIVSWYSLILLPVTISSILISLKALKLINK